MRLDNYDKWLLAGADSDHDDEKNISEYRDEIVIGCMNGDDELPEFISEDCSQINSEITQILAKHHVMDINDKEAGAALLKLLYNQFVVSLEKQADYNVLWSH